jgi:hypothetical protein
MRSIYEDIFQKWKESAVYAKLYGNICHYFDKYRVQDPEDGKIKEFKDIKDKIQFNKRHVDLVDRPTGKSYEDVRKKYKQE